MATTVATSVEVGLGLHRDHKVSDFLWRLLHRSLHLGRDRIRWPGYDGNVDCQACDGEIETYRHFLVSCPVVKAQWIWLCRVLKDATGKDIQVTTLRHAVFLGLPSHRKTSSPVGRTHRIVLSVLHGEALYTLWLHRCRALFDNDPLSFTPAAVIGTFQARARRALSAAALLRPLNEDDTAKQLLTSLFHTFSSVSVASVCWGSPLATPEVCSPRHNFCRHDRESD